MSEIYKLRTKPQYVGQPHLVLMEHIFSRWNSQSPNGDIKYSLEISLIGLIIQSVGPNHFSKELLKYIYLFIYEIGFHKYILNNIKD